MSRSWCIDPSRTSTLVSLCATAISVSGFGAHPFLNRKQRDELSHNVFLMIQECNKFREHQAREILIDLFEKELEQRIEILAKLRDQVAHADELLSNINEALDA